MKKIALSIITSLVIILGMPLIAQASPLVFPAERLSGLDRVETALKISQKGWDSAQTVILCENSDYPDAIASTPFAVSLNAPILLSKGNSIDPRVVNELKRLKPQKIILLGGTACLQPSIEKELDNLALQWERIGGADRFETSILLAKHLSSDTLILANGDDFPDALSAATFAGIKQIPIVLTSTTLPKSVIQYYQATGPKHLIVIGGEVVIPSADLSKNNLTVETRLAGLDRYETNAKVTAYMKDAYESDDLFLASGITFPDAVAGTVLASKFKAPLLLTEKEDIPPSVYTLMREHMKIEPPPKSTNEGTTPQKGIVTASSGLNLRDTPSSTGIALVTIPKDTTIELNEQQGQWYKTTYQSKTGWISANYITKSTTKIIKEPEKGTITALGSLNLRETPSPTGNVLTAIPQGTMVELIQKQAQWYKTTYQSKTGWISADYVSPATTYNVNSTTSIDLSVNGTVYILGGTAIISSNSQNIIEGKTSSKYKDNLRTFPPLPSEIKKPDPPSNGNDVITPPADPTPVATTYDPSQEVLVNPFQGIPTNALSGKTILIDPGHGGPDSGAIGPNSTYEKNNSLAIALTLNDILTQAGAKTILTRDKDISPAVNYSETEDLQARVNIANQTKPDLFISIHNNASSSNLEAQGTETYYSEDNPKKLESVHLANSIQSAAIETLKTTNRGLKESRLYVLRNTTMPAILLEIAFISNSYEEARLQNPTFRKNVATAIFHGIYNYYKNPLPKD
ncbi:MAG: N-acetylmuramoyl-L-alanine amidase [Desulfosporosinus sp. BRH_c37]|nr:MAG: N-acetylmuramoyl-L-alanine amidase [Desulfosporosinus sp. BRH_c37]